VDASYEVPEALLREKKKTQIPFTEREIIKKCLETVAGVAALDTHTQAHTHSNLYAIIKIERC